LFLKKIRSSNLKIPKKFHLTLKDGTMLVKKKQVEIKFPFPPIWSGMEINESAGMIPLYNIKPSNSFHYHSHSLNFLI